MSRVDSAQPCPACGSTLSREPSSAGLCPACILELALDDTSFEDEVLVDPEEAPTLQYSGATFEEGQIQGERYRVRSLLGRGGMGEVWRAYDLKLRQDVALKSLRTELIQDREALETLRQEVRTAREVISPNVCRVFDLQELDGQELVSMEYIDGTTLQEILEEGSPLDLDEAREVASQFLAGLEAIHAAGLVHRDIKPENLMITRTGRVVVMDFGIAKALADGKGGLIAGTPAYMSPEQTKGEDLDARADVFSAGVVLAEMVEPGGMPSIEDRQRLWERVRCEPPEVSETPWSRVIQKAVALVPAERYESASALARALEEVTLRAVGDEKARPYPGLAAFQQQDARFFFGRELEVEALWKKLRRPHLLAVIGPSGAGKSSFLRAGLLPTLTDEWQAILTTPGNRPFGHLARALATELGDAPGVTELLQRIDESDIAIELLSEWRKRSRHALLIVDQFEELFTQNPDETQARFAELLGRLPLEADLFVLLSMRDDFVMHCHRFEALRPLFSELTPLDPPLGSSLRRALVEPALCCGYRFEDEGMIEEMLAEVEGERGALPLVAFAAAQLWERRDREEGLLTRRSYEQIGGVGGALAQHAEAILDYIGEANEPIVRELFRNLVTAQGTRAARDRDELLSIFPETQGKPLLEPSRVKPVPTPPPRRPAAKHVLDSLIDARLLTSYEVPADEEGDSPHQRIEIVHESLLSSWPRLVRWRMQDAEGAKLRDELRAQAQLWDEHERLEDYLWTGTAYREFLLWRERYPGGLSTTEEDFARAMTTHAERQKRRRRRIVAAILTLALGVAVVMGALWRRSVAETRRAEAQKLLALGQVELETWPTVALAYATSSLELADSAEARLFALRALAEGMPATVLRLDEEQERAHEVAFSPDGTWAALQGFEALQIISRDGRAHFVLEPFSSDGAMVLAAFDPGGRRLFGAKSGILRAWSIPEFQVIEEQVLPEGVSRLLVATPRGVFALTEQGEEAVVTRHELGEEPQVLGRITTSRGRADIDSSGQWLAFSAGNQLLLRSLEDWTRPERLIGSHDGEIQGVVFHPAGDRLATRVAGKFLIWSIYAEVSEPIREQARSLWGLAFDPTDKILAMWGQGTEGSSAELADLRASMDALPSIVSVALPELGELFLNGATVDPHGEWLATGNVNVVGFWPLNGNAPRIVSREGRQLDDLGFTPDGARLVSLHRGGILRSWGLDAGSSGRELPHSAGFFSQLDIDPAGRRIVVGRQGGALVVPLNGGAVRELDGFGPSAWVAPAAIDAEGRLVAAASIRGPRSEKVIRIWDLETDESWTLGPTEEAGDGFDGQVYGLGFRPDGSLVSVGHGGLRIWSPRERSYEFIAPTPQQTRMTLFDEGRFAANSHDSGALAITDLETKTTRIVPEHDAVVSIAVDSHNDILVTGGGDGIVRVGPIDGERTHLLIGHAQMVRAVAISPDGKWIASGSDDGTILLWPMPDVSQTPLHALPHDQLLAKLHSLTNVRVVPDAESGTGWRVEIGPFPGWEEVPTW